MVRSNVIDKAFQLIFQKLCHKQWLPSRIESECVRGEGIVFSVTEKACSPFHEHRKSK